MFRRLPATIGLLVVLAACGGGSGTSPNPIPTPTPVPTVAITATGEGALVLHPSASSTYGFTLETPVRIQETGGGTADWNFARFSVLRGGTEIERGEVGSDIIRTAGYSRITARSNTLYTIYFRFNSDTFDTLQVTLGFSDLKDARQFTVIVTPNWASVNLNLTPARRPGGSVGKL
jgi:hypothetical protein